jgi:hypothetical protein
MAQGNDDDASRRVPSTALRHAESNNLAAARSMLEANAGPVEVSRRYADVAKALYKERKDITQMLAVAKAGIEYCLDAAECLTSKDPATSETLKTNAKVMAYNAAANSWPGWGDEGVVIEKPHIQDAIELATRSLQLVEELKLGDRQRGNGHWLIGALHIAGGRSNEAIAALTRARDAFRTGGARAYELMALGYIAVARKRGDAGERHADELDEICRQLQQDGSPDAMAFFQQLKTADRLLATRHAEEGAKRVFADRI